MKECTVVAIILEENWVFCFLALYNCNMTTSGTPLCNIQMEMSYFPLSQTRRVFLA